MDLLYAACADYPGSGNDSDGDASSGDILTEQEISILHTEALIDNACWPVVLILRDIWNRFAEA